MSDRGRGHSGCGARRTAFLSAAAFSLFVILLLTDSNAGAVTPAASTLNAPFSGVVQKTTGAFATHCGSAKVTSPNTFSMKTGRGGFAGSAKAHYCQGSYVAGRSYQTGAASGQSILEIK